MDGAAGGPPRAREPRERVHPLQARADGREPDDKTLQRRRVGEAARRAARADRVVADAARRAALPVGGAARHDAARALHATAGAPRSGPADAGLDVTDVRLARPAS